MYYIGKSVSEQLPGLPWTEEKMPRNDALCSEDAPESNEPLSQERNKML